MLSLSTLTLILSSSSALASIAVFPRAPPGCLADNCLRALTGTEPGQTQTRANRVGDCSSFLLHTVTPDTVTITQTATVTTSTTLSLATTTTTSTTALVNVKRSAVTVSPSNIPAYASPCSGAVRYSSACSCAGVTGSTVTVSAPSITIYVSATLTATIDIYSTETDVIVSTTTSSSFTSSAAASPSSSAAASSSAASCTPSGSVSIEDGSITFNQEFAGYGVSENTNNPSNQATPDITTFPGNYTGCDAAEACANYVWNVPNNDYSFDLHYLINENEWYCVGYYNALSSGADFTVVDSNVGVSYLYEY